MKNIIKQFFYLKCYLKIQLINLKTLSEYKVDFLIASILTLITQIVNITFLSIIYLNVPLISDWNKYEVLLLYTFMLFSEGVTNLLGLGIWRIPELVNQGKLDFFLLRPLPLYLQILSYRMDLDGINKIIFSLILFCFSLIKLNIRFSLFQILVVIYMLIISAIIRICLIWSSNCIAFWIEGSKSSFGYFVISLGDATKYPIQIYPKFLQTVLTFVPYAFINYFPTVYILNPFNYKVPILTLFVCILSLILSRFILREGLKKYESSGI